MDDFIYGCLGQSAFWGLPVAFARDENVIDRINCMTDEQRESLRTRSSSAKSEAELDELVRMVAEGKFE